MNAEQCLAAVGQAGAVVVLVWPLITWGVKQKFESDKKLRSDVASLTTEMKLTRSQLEHSFIQSGILNVSVKELSTSLRHTDVKLAEAVASITTVQRASERHADILQKLLPALHAEIGKLSLYYRGRKSGSDGE